MKEPATIDPRVIELRQTLRDVLLTIGVKIVTCEYNGSSRGDRRRNCGRPRSGCRGARLPAIRT